MMKIYALKHGSLNESDRLELARLLVKAGYVVSIGREKVPNRTAARIYIRFEEGWSAEET